MSKIIKFPQKRLPISLIFQHQEEIDDFIFELLETITGRTLKWDGDLIGKVRQAIITELSAKGLIDSQLKFADEEAEEFRPQSLLHGIGLILVTAEIKPFSILLSVISMAVLLAFILIVLPQIF